MSIKCENPDCKEVHPIEYLELHHKLSRRVCSAWQYETQNMILLCPICHAIAENRIPDVNKYEYFKKIQCHKTEFKRKKQLAHQERTNAALKLKEEKQKAHLELLKKHQRDKEARLKINARICCVCKKELPFVDIRVEKDNYCGDCFWKRFQVKN